MKSPAVLCKKLSLVLFVLFSISTAETACAREHTVREAPPDPLLQSVDKPQLPVVIEATLPNSKLPNPDGALPIYACAECEVPPKMGDPTPPTRKCTGPQVQTCVHGSSECVNGDVFYAVENNSYAQCLSSNGLCTGVSTICSVD